MATPGKLDVLATTPRARAAWEPTPEVAAKILAARKNGHGLEPIADALSADLGERIPRERIRRWLITYEQSDG